MSCNCVHRIMTLNQKGQVPIMNAETWTCDRGVAASPQLSGVYLMVGALWGFSQRGGCGPWQAGVWGAIMRSVPPVWLGLRVRAVTSVVGGWCCSAVVIHPELIGCEGARTLLVGWAPSFTGPTAALALLEFASGLHRSSPHGDWAAALRAPRPADNGASWFSVVT